MQIQGIYAAIAASDMIASEIFYTKLFSRIPDDHPMDSLIQWRGVGGGNFQIFRNAKNAGASLCTMVVPDMTQAREELAAAGLTLGAEQSGDFGRIAHIRDPSGNEITLAEPPRK